MAKRYLQVELEIDERFKLGEITEILVFDKHRGIPANVPFKQLCPEVIKKEEI